MENTAFLVSISPINASVWHSKVLYPFQAKLATFLNFIAFSPENTV